VIIVCKGVFIYLAHDSSQKTTIEAMNTLVLQDKLCGHK
jgi:hypothetical protein